MKPLYTKKQLAKELDAFFSEAPTEPSCTTHFYLYPADGKPIHLGYVTITAGGFTISQPTTWRGDDNERKEE